MKILCLHCTNVWRSYVTIVQNMLSTNGTCPRIFPVKPKHAFDIKLKAFGCASLRLFTPFWVLQYKCIFCYAITCYNCSVKCDSDVSTCLMQVHNLGGLGQAYQHLQRLDRQLNTSSAASTASLARRSGQYSIHSLTGTTIWSVQHPQPTFFANVL